MISDAAIQRVDLQDYSENLQWAEDGSIAISTAAQLTILRPKYQQDGVKSATKLFDVQKIEIENFPRSQAYHSQPIDEKGSTIFSSPDDFVVKLLWSPLTLTGETLLACLMGSKIVHILKNNEVKFTIGTEGVFDTQEGLNDTFSYSFNWLNVDETLYLFIGQASGNVKLYRIDDDVVTKLHSMIVSTSGAITQLQVNGDVMIAVDSDNEIFQINNIFSENDYQVKSLRGKSRSMVYDIHLADDGLFLSSPLKLQKIELSTGSVSESSTNIYEFCKIIPNGSSKLLVSHTKTRQFDEEMNIVLNDNLSVAKSKRIKKWNSKSDSFSLKNPIFKIYGADYNFNGGILAVLYEIVNEVGFRYKIQSENLLKIAFINLENQFPNIGSSLAVHQEFILSGKIPAITRSKASIKKTTNQSLKDYLKTSVAHDSQLSSLVAENIISRENDLKIRKRYCLLLVEFIIKNNVKFDNPFDKTMHRYLLNTIGQEIIGTVGPITFATNIFEESFNIDDNSDPETLLSISGHTWNRCAITFLPIISTDVKVDPVTQRRIIDISKDAINNYGEFTRTILENLNELSIYSGCRFESK